MKQTAIVTAIRHAMWPAVSYRNTWAMKRLAYGQEKDF